MLCLTAVFVFAASAIVTYSDNNIRVKSDGAAIKEVALCVIYLDAAGRRQETSLKVYNVPSSTAKPINYKDTPFTIGKVIGAYSTYCVVE